MRSLHATCSFSADFLKIAQNDMKFRIISKNAKNLVKFEYNSNSICLFKSIEETPGTTGIKQRGNETSRALISYMPRLIKMVLVVKFPRPQTPFSTNLSFLVAVMACIHTSKNDLHPAYPFPKMPPRYMHCVDPFDTLSQKE
jgi:hypothetical protein